MTKRQTAAQSEYEAAVEKFGKFCEDHTDLTPIIMDEEYPIRVQFIPDNQLTLFGNENIDENGEINDLTVSVGLSTAVKSTLKFKMDSKLLKKMIKLAETVGTLYYHAFRAQEGDRTKAKRPDYESDGYDENGNLIYDTAYCPTCRHSFEEGVNDWGCAYCSDCGQKLDWTPYPEEVVEE